MTKTQKNNYDTFWTHDPNIPKGTGTGIILKKPLGDHIYKIEEKEGRLISLYMKFKGKITIQVTGIYGVASKDPLALQTKELLNNTLNHITNNNNLHIIAGDINEDREHHRQTDTLDLLDSKNLFDITSNMDNANFTWQNSNRHTQTSGLHLRHPRTHLLRHRNIYHLNKTLLRN